MGQPYLMSPEVFDQVQGSGWTTQGRWQSCPGDRPLFWPSWRSEQWTAVDHVFIKSLCLAPVSLSQLQRNTHTAQTVWPLPKSSDWWSVKGVVDLLERNKGSEYLLYVNAIFRFSLFNQFSKALFSHYCVVSSVDWWKIFEIYEKYLYFFNIYYISLKHNKM